MKKSLIICGIILVTFTTGCSFMTPTDSYTGRHLNIGIIGDAPTIDEKRTVKFIPLTFNDLANDNYKNYDAVFIMKEQLSEASNDNYSRTYLELEKPILFIGTDTLRLFISDNVNYRPKNYEEGVSYSVGLIGGEQVKFGLNNDKENEATKKLFYSDLFRVLE